MMKGLLPACLCGHTKYAPGGARIGPSRSSQWFFCDTCGRQTLTTYQAGLTVLVVPVMEGELPNDAFDWIDGPLTITLRAYEAQVKEAQDEWGRLFAYEPACRKAGIPVGSKFDTIEQDGQYVRCLITPDGEVISTLELLYNWDAEFDRLIKDRPHPTALVAPPVLPKIPASVIVRTWLKGVWTETKHKDSAAAPVPPDPLRVRHDAYFAKVFERLKEAGFDLRWTYLRNCYHQDHNQAEPWFESTYKGGQFIVGPRKRVVNIDVNYHRPVNITAIRDLALQDDVTYEADGAYKGKEASAKTICIHAWTQDKLVEYLTVLLRQTETTQPVRATA